MGDGEIEKLRAALARRERGRGKRYTEHLKQRIGEVARVLHGRGQSWHAIGRFFGIPHETVRRFAAGVADALGTHEAGARECRGIKLAGCWAQVLRRFRAAVVDFPEAQLMFGWIGDLYRIDGKATTNEERRRLRKAESRVDRRQRV